MGGLWVNIFNCGFMPTHYVSTYHLSWKISCPLSIKERQISWISWSSFEVMDICNQGHSMELNPAQAEFLQWDCAKGIDVLPKSIDLERTNKLRGLFVRFCNYDNRQRGNNRRGKLGLLFCCCCLFLFVVVYLFARLVRTLADLLTIFLSDSTIYSH